MGRGVCFHRQVSTGVATRSGSDCNLLLLTRLKDTPEDDITVTMACAFHIGGLHSAGCLWAKPEPAPILFPIAGFEKTEA